MLSLQEYSARFPHRGSIAIAIVLIAGGTVLGSHETLAQVPDPAQVVEAPSSPAASSPAVAEVPAEESDSQPAENSLAAALDLQAALAEGPLLSEEQAIVAARLASPSLERVRALTRGAEASVERARARMWPRLELSARYTRVDGFEDGEISLAPEPEALAAAQTLAATVNDPAARQLWLGTLQSQADSSVSFAIPRNQFSLNARLTWPASDLFFSLWPAIEAAEASARATALAEDVADAQLSLRVRQAYYTLARARGGLAIARASLEAAEAQETQVQAAFRAGLVTEAEALTATAQVAYVHQAVSAAEAGESGANHALRLLMGVASGPAFGIGEDLFGAQDQQALDYDSLVAGALASRPEIEALRAGLVGSRAALRVVDARAYPHLLLFAGADLSNPSQFVIPPREQFMPSVQLGAVLSWAPNDALDAMHERRSMEASVSATEARLQELRLGIQIEVRQALEQLRAARAGVASAEAAVAAGQAAYESRLGAFEAGASTATELFGAANRLDRARLSLLDSAVSIALAGARLDHAVGR